MITRPCFSREPWKIACKYTPQARNTSIRHLFAFLIFFIASASLAFPANAEKGDINNDQKIDLTDTILALQISSGLSPNPAGINLSADVDGDNKIGVAEAIYALQRAAGAPVITPGFILEYTFGTYASPYTNIYVIWAENPSVGFYYPIYICNRLLGIGGNLTGTALPYWKVNKYPNMNTTEVDAVTGATQKMTDFSVPFTIPERSPRQFTVYFETDASYNGNDWFADQPAILYKADINLDNLLSEHALEFVGWTPNENTVSSASIELVLGGLQSETRYITNLKISTSPDAFGGADDNPQTNLVGSIRIIPDN